MSLAAAVNLIADAMEEKGRDLEKKDTCGEFVKQWLFTFSSQLRIAVTASGEGESPRRNQRPGLPRDWEFEEEGSRIDEMEQRLREGPRQDSPRVQRAVDRLSGRLRAEDQVGERVALCVGGPEDGVTVPLNPSMPEGAWCAVGGGVYQLRADGKVHFIKFLEDGPP